MFWIRKYKDYFWKFHRYDAYPWDLSDQSYRLIQSSVKMRFKCKKERLPRHLLQMVDLIRFTRPPHTWPLNDDKGEEGVFSPVHPPTTGQWHPDAGELNGLLPWWWKCIAVSWRCSREIPLLKATRFSSA